ncbi:hypothetical protein NQ318_004184, partial [Aromia moschata]
LYAPILTSGFTDGSKIGDKAGAGVYGKTTRTKLSFALGSYASVFQAEIYATLACGMEILKTAPKWRTIQICTDSQAALMAVESSKILNDLASCNRVILTWVPGHSSVPGNEEADRLARVGSIGYPTGPEPILGVPYSMGVSTMKELLNKEFENDPMQEKMQRMANEVLCETGEECCGNHSNVEEGFRRRFSFGQAIFPVAKGLRSSASTSSSDDNVKRVRDLLNTDRRLSVLLISETLDITKTIAHEIVSESLGMRKVCAKLVPKVCIPGWFSIQSCP